VFGVCCVGSDILCRMWCAVFVLCGVGSLLFCSVWCGVLISYRLLLRGGNLARKIVPRLCVCLCV
jgi:hypothetical protein